MMKTVKRVGKGTALLIAGLSLVASTTARAATADPGIAKALDAEKIKYETTNGGNYRVVLSFDDDRSQLILINSATSTFRTGKWRNVYSKAFEVKGKLSQEQANALLADGDTSIFGGWVTEDQDGTTFVYYQVAVAADATPAQLHNALALVGIAADEMEKKITTKDEN